jgi:tetratricopeptide (TPR) repeat protein
MAMSTLLRTCLLLLIGGLPTFAASKADPFVLANAAYDSGQDEKAARLYRDAGRRGNQAAIAWFNYGNCQAQLGKRGEAAAAWRKAIEWAPRFKRAWMNLAILSEEDGQIGDAANDYRRLWELDPKDATVAIRLGELQLTQNDPVGGVNWFQTALEADSVSSSAFEGLVRAQLEARDTLDARLTLMKWSEVVPDTSGRSWMAKAALWERAGDLEQARRACEGGLAYDPTLVDGWLRLARIHQLEGSEATAVAVLQAATRAEPEKGRLWKALGQAALRAGDGEIAYQGLAKAVERNEPGSRDLARILSSWHQARGEDTLAARAKTLWASPTK